MARSPKNTATTSETATVDVFDELKSEVAEETNDEVRTKNQIDRNRIVRVMNSAHGTLVYISPKTGAEWRFSEYGAVEDMEVAELLTMRSAQPKFLNEPWLVILNDDEVIEHLGLKNLYKKVLTPAQIERLFTLPESKMEQILKGLPNGMKILVVQKANEMLANGKLDSVAKRRLIESVYNVTLND